MDLEFEIPASISALDTSLICSTAIPSFNSKSTTLVNSQLVSLPSAGILSTFVRDLH